MGELDGRNDEVRALLNVEGVNTAKIQEQIDARRGIKPEQPKVTPPTEPPKQETSKEETIKQDVLNPETIRAAMLSEMFGEQFKTVEDAKKANIPASLQELEKLRQMNQELETKLKAKPKHNFASDDIAKFNEFARETGIKDATIFNKLSVAKLSEMDDIDALALQHIIDNPHFASMSPQQVRTYIEKKYGVDNAKLEAGDITQEDFDFHMMDASVEGARAKKKLEDLQGKIKMPELPADELAEGKKRWTPEIEAKKKAEWSAVNEKMGEVFNTIPIHLKGSTTPIVNFAVPEETKKAILKTAIDYVVSNQLEINEENVKPVAANMYTQIIVDNLSDIAHAIFERARTMTEEEYLKTYSNPSPKNTDKPPLRQEPLTADVKAQRAYEAEMSRR